MTATTTQARRMRADPPVEHPKIERVPALDGLRGLAVVGVLLYHGGHLKGGFLGVDAFFVLSGYLITTLLLVESARRRTISLGGFWLRRARRLLPAVFALLVAVAVYSRFVADPSQWTAIRADGLATLAYVANWHTILSGGSYGQSLTPSPLQHTWSLAIEEQFYLVWPLVVVGALAIRRSPRMVLYAASTVVVVGTGLLIGLSFAGVSQNALYLGTDTRMAAVGFGAVVAAWQAGRKRPLSAGARTAVELAAPAAFVLLLVAWATIGLDDQALYRGGLTACGLAVALIVWSLVQPGSSILGRVLSVAPLRGLGIISYGLYLWHWPIFLYLTQARTGVSGWPLFALRCTASIGAAWFSYQVIEQPIRRGRGNAAGVVSWSVVAAVVAAGALVVSAVGAPPDLFAQGSSGPTFTRADGKAPIVAFYGDSVPYILVKQDIAPKAGELGVSVVNAAAIGCEPLGGITEARDGHGEKVFGFGWSNCIDSTPTSKRGLPVRPDVSVVYFGGVQWNAKIDGTWRSPCDPVYDRAFVARYRKVVTTLLASGQRSVVLVKPAPVINYLGPLKGIDDGGQRAACLWKAMTPILTLKGVTWIDLYGHFCSDDLHCDLQGPDTEDRTDGVHYRGAAGHALAAWIVPEILRAADHTS